MMKIDKVEIDKEIVLKFLGYKNRKVPKYIDKVIDEEIQNINDNIDIRVYIEEINMKEHNFEGEYIKACFDKSEKSYAVLYTVGNKIEEDIIYYTNNNDMTRGMIIDKIGIVALDYINYKIKEYLEDECGALNVSFEVYPGDKGFEVVNQRYIYEYVRNDFISINEYGQMTPIKSVAMVVCMGDCKNSKSRCEKCLNKCI